MLRFPFNGRPVPRPPQTHEHPIPPEKKVSYEEMMKSASFSPELSFLLSMLLKDGMPQGKVMELMRDIEPYVSGGDRAAIRSILGAMHVTDEFRKSSPGETPLHTYSELSEYSKYSRQYSLLNVMQQYAGSDTSGIMRNLQRSVEMQENFDKMIKRMQKLRNMNSSSPEDMFDAMSMFMPPEQMSGIRNMQNMMRMMGSMKNFKPEDMMKFMGGMGNMGGMGGTK